MPFNLSQIEAIRQEKGPCMVLAGPGSGKTTVITERLIVLTEKKRINPEQILVVTFTKAAAREMKTRYLKKTGKVSTEITFGTFHSVFFGMLKLQYQLRESNILTEPDKMAILEEICQGEDIGLETDRDFLNSVLSEISLVKNNMKDPDTYISQNPRIPFGKIFHRYEEKTRKKGKLDFDDMLTMTYQLLKSRTDVLSFWQKRFQFIMVDEFQDINLLQYGIIRLLALPENNLFIVGDDDQSIYRFRGSMPEIMLNFPKDYPGTRQILLDINYRSGKAIVRESLRLIQQNGARFEKKLKAFREDPGEIYLGEFESEKEEDEKVVSSLQKLSSQMPWEEMAVLFRTNSSANHVFQSLSAKKIPFYAREQIRNIFQNPLARGILAYLNWMLGCRSRNNFLKMMNAPNRYIYREDLKSEEVSLEDLKNFYRKNESRKWMAEKIEWLEYQITLLYRLRTPYAMINYIRKGMGYDDYVKELAEKRKADEKEYLLVLDEIQSSARTYETIEDWYEHIASYTRELKKQKEEGKEDLKNKVFISSLHGAKGLEFKEVFIVDVNEKIIPHERATTTEELEEERRILYVGMTRAKNGLHLYSVKERFGKKMEPSRFLKEL